MRPRTNKLSKKMRDRLFIALFLLPGLLMILVMLYYPALDGIVMSFQDVKSYNIFSKKFIGLENFRHLFANITYLGTWKNTAIWVFGCVSVNSYWALNGCSAAEAFFWKKTYECVVFHAVGAFRLYDRHMWKLDVQRKQRRNQ